MQEVEIEDVIAYLTGPRGLKINDLIDSLTQGNRGLFQSWRRSVKKARKIEMVKALIEAFPEHFPNGQLPAHIGGNLPENPASRPAPNAGQPIEIRYIEMLERDNDALRAEVEALKTENRELIKEMRGELNQARKQAFQRAT